MRRETFETPGEVTLDIRVPSGRIDLETVSGTTTEVELDARGGADQVRELLDDARIELREAHGGHEVVVDVEGRRGIGFGFLRKLDVRLTIRTPEGAHVRGETASADLRGRGRFGSLAAKAASGDVDLDDICGDASVEAASGDVRLGSVGGAAEISTASGDAKLGRVEGQLSARAASGDVSVDEAGSGVEIRTASGDQRIGAVVAGNVNLQSMSGDIKIGIRQGSNLWVDAKAMSGDLSSELALGDEPPEEDAPLVELRAASMSGDIDVVRAPAAAASRVE
jgi:DUF4097 and DUF4098 domain-containing protein YvlB